MQNLSKGGLLLLCGILLLTGCSGSEMSRILPQNLAKTELQSQSYHLSFYSNGPDGFLRAQNGQGLSSFLQKLTLDPPGYVKFQPVGNSLTERDIVTLLEQSGLHRRSAVDIMPGTLATTKGRVLDVVVTYYSYTLGNCGAHLDQRLLDHTAMTSPGFGCAVNRNRMMSLVNPGSTQNRNYLAPPLARSEVKAVTTYQRLAPVPFPPANQ
ncbi:CpaD family pilus assembly lipoprotein [Sneathiella litorea]|uniref:Pilus assembly protein CpaD n=1 Tax=Sneathiella litorea TaxID=2606216 RepID=A0A6L8WBG6_9PROT|nr:CpaD family pilus assembly lipoprotein [Sneathiella litorea]MZR31812.1 hypothetical protein [Sneathiella litorea]